MTSALKSWQFTLVLLAMFMKEVTMTDLWINWDIFNESADSVHKPILKDLFMNQTEPFLIDWMICLQQLTAHWKDWLSLNNGFQFVR